jgi:hypothetical protein
MANASAWGKRGAVPSARPRHPVCTAEDRRCRFLYSLTRMADSTSERVRPAGPNPAGSTLAEPDFGPNDGVHLTTSPAGSYASPPQ